MCEWVNTRCSVCMAWGWKNLIVVHVIKHYLLHLTFSAVIVQRGRCAKQMIIYMVFFFFFLCVCVSLILQHHILCTRMQSALSAYQTVCMLIYIIWCGQQQTREKNVYSDNDFIFSWFYDIIYCDVTIEIDHTAHLNEPSRVALRAELICVHLRNFILNDCIALRRFLICMSKTLIYNHNWWVAFSLPAWSGYNFILFFLIGV